LAFVAYFLGSLHQMDPIKQTKLFLGKSSQENKILIDSNRNARLADVEMEDRMKGKTCVITGATSGIGKAAAFALAAKGACLVIIGRNTARGERISSELRAKYPSAQFEYRRADLSSLDDVRELAAAISAKHRRIDVLINNAGARYDRYHESADGFELTFATNHLGHFLLNLSALGLLARIGFSANYHRKFQRSCFSQDRQYLAGTNAWIRPPPSIREIQAGQHPICIRACSAACVDQRDFQRFAPRGCSDWFRA